MIKSLKFFFTFLFSMNLSTAIIIDVRTAEEWKTGHLENADNLEWQNILELSSYIAKDETIYLYCRSGNRSGKAANVLIDNGFLNAINAGSISEASKSLNKKIIN